jgi:hypothetical protein
MTKAGVPTQAAWNRLVDAVEACFVGSFTGGEVDHRGPRTQLRVHFEPHVDKPCEFQAFWESTPAGDPALRVTPGLIGIVTSAGGTMSTIAPTLNAVPLNDPDAYFEAAGLTASATYSAWLLWDLSTATVEVVESTDPDPEPPTGGWKRKISTFQADSSGYADRTTLVIDWCGNIDHTSDKITFPTDTSGSSGGSGSSGSGSSGSGEEETPEDIYLLFGYNISSIAVIGDCTHLTVRRAIYRAQSDPTAANENYAFANCGTYSPGSSGSGSG